MQNLGKNFIKLSSLFIIALSSLNAAAESVSDKVVRQINEIRDSGQFNNDEINRQLRLKGLNQLDQPTPFILGGQNAARNAFSEFALIILTNQQGDVTGLCGGTVISKNTVLTAAHCAQDSAVNYFIIPDFYSFNDRLSASDLVRLSRIVNHPSYRDSSLDFDIAVMTLRENTSITPAKVVTGNNQFAGRAATVIGVGLTATQPTPVSPTVLQELRTSIVSNSQCSASFLGLSGIDPITENMLCAGFLDNSNGTCSGDSGSPLFVDLGKEKAIAGVVSFGFPTCEANRATSAYARTSVFTDFIATQSPNTEFIASNPVNLTAIYSLLLDDTNTPTLPPEPTPPPLTASDIVPSIPSDFDGKYYINIQTIFDASASFGQDSTYVYTQKNSNVDFVNNFSDSLEIRIDGAGQLGVERIDRAEDWRLNLSRPRLGFDQGRLTAGIYNDARRFPFNDFDNGLSLSGLGSGCNTLTGSFRIVEIEYTNDVLTKLLADFQQRCDGSNRKMIGSIDFDASREDAVLPPIALPLGSPSPTLPDGSTLIVEGSENTFIVRDTLLLSTSNSTFSASSSSPNSSISISITTNEGNTRYSLDMRRSSFDIDPLRNTPLSVGVYENATRAAFSEPLAGLTFSGNGSGCNTSAGSFNIYEIMFDQSGELRRLVADFEQFCGSRSEPIRGSIDLDLSE